MGKIQKIERYSVKKKQLVKGSGYWRHKKTEAMKVVRLIKITLDIDFVLIPNLNVQC